MSENAALQEKTKDLEGTILTRNGENSILRNQMLKAQTEFERKMASSTAIQVEERNKLANELAKKREEIEQMKSEKMFMDREYKDVVNDNSRLSRNLKAKENTARPSRMDVMATPKKKTKFGDGFDDYEVGMIRSSPPVPIPGSGRGKTTPSKTNGKRKRRQGESPMKPSQQTFHLPLSQPYLPSPHASRHNSFEEDDEDAYDTMIDNLTLEELDLVYDNRQEVRNSISYSIKILLNT